MRAIAGIVYLISTRGFWLWFFFLALAFQTVLVVFLPKLTGILSPEVQNVLGACYVLDRSERGCAIAVNLEIALGFYAGCFWLLSSFPFRFRSVRSGGMAIELSNWISPVLVIAAFIYLDTSQENTTLFQLVAMLNYTIIITIVTLATLLLMLAIIVALVKLVWAGVRLARRLLIPALPNEAGQDVGQND